MDSSSLADIQSSFARDEFSYDPTIYAEYVRAILKIGSPPDDEAEAFFELLERVLDMLWATGSPQLNPRDRDAILALLRSHWNPGLPAHRRATMVTIAGYLLPHDGTRQWLLEEASKTTGELADYLRRIADAKRDGPVT